MNKHEKQVRRERRKAEQSRRRSLIRNPKSAIRNGGAALVAAGALAAGTQAYATVVRFDNPAGPGHFDWTASPGSFLMLDLTLDAASQPGNTHPGNSGGQADVFADGPSTIAHFFDPATGGMLTGNAQSEVGGTYGLDLIGLSAGNVIPSGLSWNTYRGYAYYPGYGSQLPDGVPTYIGMRFDLGAGFQYGWIGVIRNPGSIGAGALDAFAWGYETEPGVPIAAGAPEPGTLAVLALGAVGVLKRRRG